MEVHSGRHPIENRMNAPSQPCAKCRASPPTHALRNATLFYCSDCLIAAMKKRVRHALVDAISSQSLDLSCRLAVAVSTRHWERSASSAWCAWHILREHVSGYKGRVGLPVEALWVRVLCSAEGRGEPVGADDDVAPIVPRIIEVDGRALDTVQDPTGREDLRRILIRHVLREELLRGDLDCTLITRSRIDPMMSPAPPSVPPPVAT